MDWKAQGNFFSSLNITVRNLFYMFLKLLGSHKNMQKEFLKNFDFLPWFFVTCLNVELPSVKWAWQLCRWCYAHVLIIILQQHHKKSPQKVSSRYLNWFLRNSTFCVLMGSNFMHIQPSWVHFVPMKAEFE